MDTPEQVPSQESRIQNLETLVAHLAVQVEELATRGCSIEAYGLWDGQ